MGGGRANQLLVNFGTVSARAELVPARTFLAKLPEQSVDLIVTSPPYCMGKEYEASVSVDDFVTEVRSVLPDMVRSLKPGGSLCWQVGYHVRKNAVTPLDALVYLEAREFEDLYLRNRIVWSFGHGAHLKKRFSGRHETILWFSKGEDYHFDLDAVRVTQKYPGKRHYKGAKKGEWSGNPLGKNPEDVWEIPNVKASHIEKTPHPCQFPVALVQRLVKALCPAGGLVVDPYLGSGTSAVGALLERCNFAGSEIESRYLDIARERLEALAGGKLSFRADLPVREPEKNEAVAQTPPHFLLRDVDGVS